MRGFNAIPVVRYKYKLDTPSEDLPKSAQNPIIMKNDDATFNTTANSWIDQKTKGTQNMKYKPKEEDSEKNWNMKERR